MAKKQYPCYQLSDPTQYYFTKEGISPFQKYDYLIFRINQHNAKGRQNLFHPDNDGPLKGKVRFDFAGQPIDKGDYVMAGNKKDRGFFKVVNYSGKKSVIIEDMREGGRTRINCENLFVVSTQINQIVERKKMAEAKIFEKAILQK